MNTYHKIQTVFVRNPDNQYKTLIEGQFALPEFEYLATNEWTFTEKIDGTNVRVIWTPSESPRLTFRGKTDRAQFPTSLYSALQEMFPEHKLNWEYPDLTMTLYGEGYGAKIQKGGGNYIPDGVSFILFDVRVGDLWLKREDVEDVAAHLNITTVPVVGRSTLYDAVEVARGGFRSRIGSQIAEGLVMRPTVELMSRTGKRVIAKIKYKDFAR